MQDDHWVDATGAKHAGPDPFQVAVQQAPAAPAVVVVDDHDTVEVDGVVFCRSLLAERCAAGLTPGRIREHASEAARIGEDRMGRYLGVLSRAVEHVEHDAGRCDSRSCHVCIDELIGRAEGWVTAIEYASPEDLGEITADMRALLERFREGA